MVGVACKKYYLFSCIHMRDIYKTIPSANGYMLRVDWGPWGINDRCVKQDTFEMSIVQTHPNRDKSDSIDSQRQVHTRPSIMKKYYRCRVRICRELGTVRNVEPKGGVAGRGKVFENCHK